MIFKIMKSYYKICDKIKENLVYTFSPTAVLETIMHNEPANHSIKLASCNIGSVQREIIEPLDEKYVIINS